MTIRERTEDIEKKILSPRASLACQSRGRARPEEPCELRTVYQRDRDRIIHSKSFRRLKHKTQVFLAPEGDHYRTRLTHTLEVAQIARTISRSLRLNEDLTEAIALGHDLGHTPFGHAGEKTLDKICPGGFRHYEQSVRVTEKFERGGMGLNLTYEVLNGMERHTEGEMPFTLEGRVVRLSDRIAYINHDIDDAIRAGVLSEGDIPQNIRRELGSSHSMRIDTLINDTVRESAGAGDIGISPKIQKAFDELYDFMFQKVYLNPIAKGEEIKVKYVISQLFDYFRTHPENLHSDFCAVVNDEGAERAACDYIAGMTDHYAIQVYSGLFIPGSWKKL